MFFHQISNSQRGYRYNAFLYEDSQFRPHFHNNLELICSLQGTMTVSAGDKQEQLGPDTFALILPNVVHALKQEQGSVCWIGVFSADYVPEFIKQLQGKGAAQTAFYCSAGIQALFRELLLDLQAAPGKIQLPQGTQTPQPKPELLLLKGCLYGICGEFLRQVSLTERSSQSTSLMEQITLYISRHYSSRITLANMARELGYNYHYLSKCFHRIFGVSFAEYVNSYRLSQALTQLAQTEREVSRIALDSGFQSIRSFHDYFKSRIGISPSRYRKELALEGLPSLTEGKGCATIIKL